MQIDIKKNNWKESIMVNKNIWNTDWIKYEQEKYKIFKKSKNQKEYDIEIKKLCKRLGI
jgi:hypothetical protein